MRVNLCSFVAVMSLMVSFPCWADTTPPASTDPTPAASGAPSDDDMVCRREAVTGSLIPSRVCMTRGQWKQLQTNGQNDVNNMQTRGGAVTTQGH